MNKNERLMVELLRRGKESHGVVSVKAEFEAEGTRIDELLRLADIARTAGLPLTVKIGGCEAMLDLMEAKQVGVRNIVAPMVETPYALSKFIMAKNVVFSEEDQEDVDFLVNMETITAYNHREEMLDLAAEPDGIDGVVFGRVDFSGSMGRDRSTINDPDITGMVIDVAQACKDRGLDLVMGGAISVDSLDVVKEVAAVWLTRFETRKVVFSGEAVKLEGLEAGLLNAVHFELLWLVNKQDYYARIAAEDNKRLDMLQARWDVLGKGVH
ncbi:MAG: aldolase/citrate lyase family protein [Actinomycetes bacterium]